MRCVHSAVLWQGCGLPLCVQQMVASGLERRSSMPRLRWLSLRGLCKWKSNKAQGALLCGHCDMTMANPGCQGLVFLSGAACDSAALDLIWIVVEGCGCG